MYILMINDGYVGILVWSFEPSEGGYLRFVRL